MRLIAGLLALNLAATPAIAEEWDFVLTNDTGKPIAMIELAPAGTTDWKPQSVDPEVKRAPVRDKARTTIRFDKADGKCRYDLKATFEDSTSQVWNGANLCDNSYVTLKLAGDRATLVLN